MRLKKVEVVVLVAYAKLKLRLVDSSNWLHLPSTNNVEVASCVTVAVVESVRFNSVRDTDIFALQPV